jgi:hypothetical protein
MVVIACFQGSFLLINSTTIVAGRVAAGCGLLVIIRESFLGLSLSKLSIAAVEEAS